MTTPGKSQAQRDNQKTETTSIEEEGQEREAMSNPNLDETGDQAEDDFSELLDEDVVEDEDETDTISR